MTRSAKDKVSPMEDVAPTIVSSPGEKMANIKSGFSKDALAQKWLDYQFNQPRYPLPASDNNHLHPTAQDQQLSRKDLTELLPFQLLKDVGNDNKYQATTSVRSCKRRIAWNQDLHWGASICKTMMLDILAPHLPTGNAAEHVSQKH